MKSVAVVCLSALVLWGQAAQLRDLVSPVSRVVSLLNGLSTQIEKEGKAEENLFETFVCWGKSVIAQKEESNSAAQSRIDSLQTYIADLSSGKIELTTERQDLEKEIEELSADLEIAKSMRAKENSDFESAKEEMTKAITALSSAVKVLNEATKDHKKGALMTLGRHLSKEELNGGMAALVAESASLDQAVSLGQRFLTKADALFLRRLLTGDVPKRDQKMLRKKADFKMSYKARSGKIQDVLSKLTVTFKTNLKDAQNKEKESQGSYDKLSKAKGAQLKAGQDALSKQDVENGARGMSKSNAQDEVKALQTQVSEDNKFVKQTKASLVEKKKEWGDRSELRAGELAAISKAVNILHNDDSRDLFKKSFSSQFLQMDTSLEASEAMATFGHAATELRQIARATGDRRLSALAALTAECSADPSAKLKFKPVLAAIDKMLSLLQSEAKKDLETKQTCEEDRQKDSRTILLASREIDDNTDTISKLEGEIKDVSASIANILSQKKKAGEELDAAKKIRQDENVQFKITDKEDQDAADTVKSAKDVLTKYYQEAFKASFVQNQKAVVVAAGAPAPPPATWSKSYGGKKGESTGIVSILEMVHADILKDKATAEAEEQQAQKEFNTFKKSSEKQMQDLQTSANEQGGVKGKKETDKVDTIKSRSTKKGEWDAVMKKMKDIAPDCEYYTVNFKLRLKNRQIEADGLNKAKAILQGGSFKKML